MVTDTTYHLDLPTLLQFLRDQSAVLSTIVDISPIRKSCYGYLLLKNRAIIDCQIQSQNGTVLYRGQEAYQLLNTKTQWQVRIEATYDDDGMIAAGQQERSRRNAKEIFSISDTYIPRVIKSLEPSLLNGYTLQQRVILRTVFAMINGQRAVAQMKEQLHLSSEAVNEALTSLKSIGVIE